MQYTTEELSAILSQHSKWLKGEDGGERADLQRANLRGADLQGANLQGADLRGADLQRANLQDADLQDANLQRADLQGAHLRGADLQRADLDFSCLPLWCCGSKFKADAKLMAQIAAHFCAIECDDPAYIAARAAVLSFALTSHRASDLGLKE